MPPLRARLSRGHACVAHPPVLLASPPFATDSRLGSLLLTAFEAFPCYELGEGGSWLIVDMEVQCYTPQHTRTRLLALVAIILYPIGQLALYATLLVSAHKAILSMRPSTLSTAIHFLHRDYKPDFFWWELLEVR